MSLIDCPDRGLPAEIVNRFALNGTSWPVEHVERDGPRSEATMRTRGGRRRARTVSLSLRLAPLVLAAAVVAGPIAVAEAAKDDLSLVNRVSGVGGAAGNGAAYSASVSADGRFVAFSSEADNLSGDDNNAVTNIYVRDLQTQSTILVSRGAKGTAADDHSLSPSISADGRFVAFHSRAGNLTGAVGYTGWDIFVRDLETNSTRYVSPGAAGGAADGDSYSPSISADGRFVAFQSDAANMSTEDADAFTNVYVRDLQTNTTLYASRASGMGGTKGNGDSQAPAISGDGRFVAFDSKADSLSGDDDDTYTNIFVRDLQTHATIYASRASSGTPADNSSFLASISGDGRFVAFSSDADTLSGEDDDAVYNVFVRDLQRATTTVVNRGAGGAADGDSFFPSISADGRYVAFSSAARNLSADDQGAFRDIFVRDVQANTTLLVSRAGGATGAPGDGDSDAPSISDDGRFVAFSSPADNLSTEDDDNAVYNVFVRDVLGEPAPLPAPLTPAPPAAAAPDTTGPGLLASALASANRAIRVSRRGRFTLVCGRYTEPVTGTCRVRKLATRPFAAVPGRRVLARFRLSRATFRALKRAQRLRMRATVVARDGLGNATAARFRFTLKAPGVRRSSGRRAP